MKTHINFRANVEQIITHAVLISISPWLIDNDLSIFCNSAQIEAICYNMTVLKSRSSVHYLQLRTSSHGHDKSF